MTEPDDSEFTVCILDERGTNAKLREHKASGVTLCGRSVMLIQTVRPDGGPIKHLAELLDPHVHRHYGGAWLLDRWLNHQMAQGDPAKGVGGLYRMCRECSRIVAQALACGTEDEPTP